MKSGNWCPFAGLVLGNESACLSPTVLLLKQTRLTDVSNLDHSNGGLRARREVEEGPVALVASTGPRHSTGRFRSQRRHGRPSKVLKPV